MVMSLLLRFVMKKINQVFVVGFPRSGTSLLQSVIASHPDVMGFTESHYFFHRYICPFDKLGLSVPLSDVFFVRRPRFDRKIIRRFFDENQIQYSYDELSSISYSSDMDHYWMAKMDKAALHANKNTWSEKSTVHLRRIPVIKKISHQAKFVHLIRRFPAVFHSWEKASLKYKLDYFSRPKRIVNKQWRRDIKRSQYYCTHDPTNHHLVTYEELCRDPHAVLGSIMNFLALKQVDIDLCLQLRVAGDLTVKKEEKWKINVKRGIHTCSTFDCAGAGEDEEIYKMIKLKFR